MSEHETLRTATINAAELLGLSGELGSIAVGKRADFIVCDENPLDDISNLRHITYVIKDGKVVCGEGIY
jgi:imidazolonepropionase-like amidohydrolase